MMCNNTHIIPGHVETHTESDNDFDTEVVDSTSINVTDDVTTMEDRSSSINTEFETEELDIQKIDEELSEDGERANPDDNDISSEEGQADDESDTQTNRLRPTRATRPPHGRRQGNM